MSTIKNLVIVESPAKAKTIEKFLGKDFVVKSSFGHVRDLSKKQLGVNIEKDFQPEYEITADKVKVVKELKKMASEAETVWLASDEDREGEAIAWHLKEALGLKDQKLKRIVFHEITENAIRHAVDNPRGINIDLVDAQQARRVLDRLVGFELSPVLWRKVKPSLSAGRVQSVAVRLIVERENEIRNFQSVFAYRVTARFTDTDLNGNPEFQAELNERFATKEDASAFLSRCIDAAYRVSGVEKKPAKKSPAPPFTTSTLQQEASRKLGFSVAKTMMVAQQLYEEGKITYMRTDSVNLSNLALNMAKKEITSRYGEDYVKVRKFTTKTKGAQEAHEAIRPTYLNNPAVSGDTSQQKLYDLIWKRTIASQMSDAELERTTVTIDISTTNEKFIAKGEVIKFDGFLKVYMEGTDEESPEGENATLPPVKSGDHLDLAEMLATQKYSQPPYRYTEASLVKKLEELGIGRPSTYAPTISTIQKREYVEKTNKPGQKRDYTILKLKKGRITEDTKTETYGYDKGKLAPTDMGNLVTTFLMENFENIMDYHFTANVEKEFDEIAQGQKVWNQMIREFYHPFSDQIKDTIKNSERVKGERLLGVDPESGNNVYVRIGRFGPMVQIGEADDENKPRFASLAKGQSMDEIDLKGALKLFEYPRYIGTFENADVTVAIGRFGPYVKHSSAFYSLMKSDDPQTIDLTRAVELIEAKRLKESQKLIKTFDEDASVQVLNGRYGPYIAIGKSNYRIPKGTDPASLTLEQIRVLAAKADESPKAKKRAPRTKK